MLPIERATQSPTLPTDSEHGLDKSGTTATAERNSSGPLANLPIRHRSSDTNLRQYKGPHTVDLFTSEDVDAITDELADFHARKVEGLHINIDDLQTEVSKLKGTLNEVAGKLLKAQLGRDERTKAAKAESRNRAISREQEISHLTSENDALRSDLGQAHKALGQMESNLAQTSSRLEGLHADVDRKSKVILGQKRSIQGVRGERRQLANAFQDAVGRKEVEIANLKEKLADAQAQIAILQGENHTLQRQLDSVTTTASGLTSNKAKALIDSGQQIRKELAVLQGLNQTLLSERKDFVATNKANMVEIAELKATLVQLMQRMGIEP